PATLPFTYDDLYDADQRKRIAPRLAHLPRPLTRALIKGLLETDGERRLKNRRGKEIHFTSASRPLAEGLRYQLLRLGMPASGQRRTNDHTHPSRGADDPISSAGSEAW